MFWSWDVQVKVVVIVLIQSLSFVWLFCDPTDYSPPGSSVRGISQTRILEWVAISFSRASFWLRDWICVSYLGRIFFFLTIEPPGKPQQVKFSDFCSLCSDSWIIIDVQRRVWLHCVSIDDYTVFFICSEWWMFFLTNSETEQDPMVLPPHVLCLPFVCGGKH